MNEINRPIQWGIFGLGRVVQNGFTPALLASERALLVACAAYKPEQAQAFADKFKIARAHADFAAMLRNPEVDAVYIATPNSLHFEHASQALAAGKHVLCEKPLAMTAQEGQQLVAAAAAANRLLAVCFQFRFEPVLARVRELVLGGAIGELRALTLHGASPVGQARSWRQNAAEGGVLSDLGVHLLDLARWITGKELTDISARTTPPDMTRDPVQTITLLGRLGPFAHALVHVTREVPDGLNALSVEGTAGTLLVPAWRNATEYELIVRNAEGLRSERIAPANLFRGQIDAFSTALAGQPSGLAMGEDGLRVIEMTVAISRASGGLHAAGG